MYTVKNGREFLMAYCDINTFEGKRLTKYGRASNVAPHHIIRLLCSQLIIFIVFTVCVTTWPCRLTVISTVSWSKIRNRSWKSVTNFLSMVRKTSPSLSSAMSFSPDDREKNSRTQSDSQSFVIHSKKEKKKEGLTISLWKNTYSTYLQALRPDAHDKCCNL